MRKWKWAWVQEGPSQFFVYCWFLKAKESRKSKLSVPQPISSEWSLQSGRPSQSKDTEMHSSLCWQKNWPGSQRCTVTFPPPEGDVVTLLGVTSSSAKAEEEKLYNLVREGCTANIRNNYHNLVYALTSSAAEDLHAQVKRVPVLCRHDAHVASSDQPTEPAGHGGPAHHPYLKHLHSNREDTLLHIKICNHVLQCWNYN